MSPSYGDELMRSARALARLQTQRRKLRRQLKTVEKEIKAERRNLKALADRNQDPDLVPSRVFGAGVGHKWRAAAAAAEQARHESALALDLATLEPAPKTEDPK